MLFAESACFAHAYNLLLDKVRESDDNSFRLYTFELLDIDVTYPFVPQLYVGIVSKSLGKHRRFHLL